MSKSLFLFATLFTKGEPLIYSCAVQAKTMIRLIPSASLTLCLVLTSCFAADGAADRVYRNGKVFTADAEGSIAQAIAIRDGRIVYVGSDEGVTRLIGSSTQVTDLAGRFLMPGLVDGHMHPLFGGLQLQKCSLNYESLTIPDFQQSRACTNRQGYGCNQRTEHGKHPSAGTDPF